MRPVYGPQHGIDAYDEHWVPLSKGEDQWDLIVAKAKGDWIDTSFEGSWGGTAMTGRKGLMDAFTARHKKTLNLAMKMVDIVEKEEELEKDTA